jgi:transposase InsO family protein
MKFILEAEAAERPLAEVCRAYGISRKTGYKWLQRYQSEGVGGLADRSRAPRQRPNAISNQIEQQVLELRAQRPYWGERKLHCFLERERPQQGWPAPSTIGALLKRHGLTHPPRRRRRATPSPQLSTATEPNLVWAIDFKGHFLTADGQRCDPLTISDTASRYLLRCQAVEKTDGAHVRALLEATFREYGLPAAIRSDNGPPFASVGLGGLSRLAVWWIRLGVMPERIEPGHPEQNGRHERLHRTLKQETANPPKATGRAQQKAFDAFRKQYNQERPHEALEMNTPASVYVPSPREYPARLPEIEYPEQFRLRRVQVHGDIVFGNRGIFLSEVLSGEVVALEEQEQGWRVWFGPLELAWLDEKELSKRPGNRPSRVLRPRAQARPLRSVCGRPTGSLRRSSKAVKEETSPEQSTPAKT